MPFYVGDYLSDTMALTTTEHGAYLLLIMAYWKNSGPLPDDDTRLAATAKLSQSDWSAIRRNIASFFQIGGGVWQHKRIDAELERAQNLAKAKSRAGLAGNLARWGTSQPDRSRIAAGSQRVSQNDPPSPSPSQVQKEEGKAASPPRTHLGQKQGTYEEVEFWNSHPKLKKVQSVSPNRVASLRARRKDEFWVANYRAAVGLALQSAFCMGDNPKGWVINFDFMLQPGSVAKIMEGNYSNNGSGGKPKPPVDRQFFKPPGGPAGGYQWERNGPGPTSADFEYLGPDADSALENYRHDFDKWKAKLDKEDGKA